MSINLTIKYTELDYKTAISEQISRMPNRYLHTYVPSFILAFLIGALRYFDFLATWWGIGVTLLLSTYAVVCLFGSVLVPQIAVVLNKSKKLQHTYHFSINAQHVKRATHGEEIIVLWEQFTSVEFTKFNVFLNLADGTMLIPKHCLTHPQLVKLKIYAHAEKEK